MRLRLVPQQTNWDFFRHAIGWVGFSGLAIVASFVAFFAMGLNYGIDFSGGTTIRTQSAAAVDVAQYRAAVETLDLGEVSITEIFDPTFGPNKHVTSIAIQAQDGAESISQEQLIALEAALQNVAPDLTFQSVESVGPTVSGELIWTAVKAVSFSLIAVLIYVWLRFEWQFALGAVAALAHDVILTIGVFSVFQIRFDLAIIAALLTIVGYSLNDTVVIFDRVRENLRRFKQKPLIEVLNLSINETMSRTLMTAVTTLIALIALIVLGGDVIRGFVFAMIWGIIVGTYSSIFIASSLLLWLGVKRDWSKPDAGAGMQVPVQE